MPVTSSRSRIVLVCESTGGGVGKHVLDLAERLPSYDFDVLLVYSSGRADSAFGERVAAHRQYGYQIAKVDAKRAPGLHDLAGLAALRRAVRAFGSPVILHGHSSKGGAIARLAQWRIATHVVYTPNAFYTQNPLLSAAQRRLFGAIELALAAITDRIIVVSRDEYDHALRLGIPSAKLVLIENGVALRSREEIEKLRRRTRDQFGLRDSDSVVGFVGRLAPQKAPDIAVQVFRRLHEQDPSIRVLIVGDGPEASTIRALTEHLGLGEVVRWVPAARGADIMPALDVLLLTSRYEGFPYVLLEALESGCAIVTTRVGGAPDTVTNGENGFIVEGGCVDELADRVLRICTHRPLLETMRLKSRARATAFSVERMVSRTVDVYRSWDGNS